MNGEQGKWLARADSYYQEPQRHYHTGKHLRSVLCLLQHWSRVNGFTDIPSALFFAALFHDAVYAPHRKDNEEQSALLCRHLLIGARISRPIIDQAEALILSTKTHVPVNDGFAARALLNADLWILGASWDDYCDYAAQIRQEYAHVPLDAFSAGRASVLTAFLNRPTLYHGEEERIQRRTEHARRNLHAELKILQR